MEQRTCELCGKELTGRQTRFCSTKHRRIVNKREAKARGASWAAPLRDYPPFDCATCGRACVPGENCGVQATRFCSVKCKRQKLCPRQGPHSRVTKREPRAWVEGPCPECATRFIRKLKAGDIVGYCSDRCYLRNKRRRYRRRYGNRASHRARRYGVQYEPVIRTEIFQRDDYRCGICGIYTDPSATAPEPRAPTLDHVIPISKGGPHTYSNIQCACFECNWRKADALDLAL